MLIIKTCVDKRNVDFDPKYRIRHVKRTGIEDAPHFSREDSEKSFSVFKHIVLEAIQQHIAQAESILYKSKLAVKTSNTSR